MTLGNRPLFSPVWYMTANFREHRVLINNTFCHQPAASVLSPSCIMIVGLHMLDVAEEGPDVVHVNEGEGQAQCAQPGHFHADGEHGKNRGVDGF